MPAPNGRTRFRRACEARQAAAGAQGADAVAPAGEDLVGVGLVADVPDQAIAGRVEYVVNSDRQLDHPSPDRDWRR